MLPVSLLVKALVLGHFVGGVDETAMLVSISHSSITKAADKLC